MTGFEKLENSLIDVIKEEQAKLGFKEEKIHLYYGTVLNSRLVRHMIQVRASRLLQVVLLKSVYILKEMNVPKFLL